MPDETQRINIGNWNDKLRALMGKQGGEAVSYLHDLLVPVVVVEDDRIEWEFAAGHTLMGLNASAGVVAGEFRYVALVNVPDSGVLVIVEAVWVHNTQEVELGWLEVTAAASPFLGGEDAASHTDMRTRDSRHGGKVSPSPCIRTIGGNAIALIGAPIARIQSDTRENPFVAGNPRVPVVILQPGSAFIVEGGTVGTDVQVSMLWREKALFKGVRG